MDQYQAGNYTMELWWIVFESCCSLHDTGAKQANRFTEGGLVQMLVGGPSSAWLPWCLSSERDQIGSIFIWNNCESKVVQISMIIL